MDINVVQLLFAPYCVLAFLEDRNTCGRHVSSSHIQGMCALLASAETA